MDAAERQFLAEAFEHAARQLDGGMERLLVEESLRTALAAQPSSGQWIGSLDTILQKADSPDSVKYANNLRKISKELKQ